MTKVTRVVFGCALSCLRLRILAFVTVLSVGGGLFCVFALAGGKLTFQADSSVVMNLMPQFCHLYNRQSWLKQTQPRRIWCLLSYLPKAAQL